ncbi:MAG: phospholipase D-like domain-containing protein [Bacteroidales bacterium]|nr:phospholipase D-like domain-containing protein [Bacteroidales bacterium]
MNQSSLTQGTVRYIHHYAMANIYDNIELRFEQGLNDIIADGGVKRVDFCVGYFNLRGWDLVVDQVDQLEGDYVIEGRNSVHRTCRLLVGMHQPPEDLVRMLYSQEDYTPDAEMAQRVKRKIADSFRKQLLLGIPTKHDEWTLRRLATQLRSGKVVVKLAVKGPIHAKLYLGYNPDSRITPIVALMGSSNLTYSGLKYQGELNVKNADDDQARRYAQWFVDRWNDNFSLDITEDLIRAIEDSWAADKVIPPYYIYLKIAYHLSEEARNGVKEYTLSPEFQHDLFDFQQNAVKIVAHHLNNDKRRGAMIGDVVGLGKTITACAVAKIFEMDRGGATLIICPANLQEMWRKYIDKYDLKAEVVSMSKPIDVDRSRYYRLIIIDESHNLRNGGKRYNNIKQLIERLGSRVLLLTATPYNKHYNDLANQLRLFIADDQDLGIRPERYIESVGGERGFMTLHSDTHIRTISAFQRSENVEDWNELMKLFLVRRTRSFIKEHFALTDPQDGRKYLKFSDGRISKFPDRLPRSVKFKTTPGDQYSRLYSEEMIDLMSELKLPRYGLSNFINEKAVSDAPRHIQNLLDNLSRAGERMMGFCRSTFFKRMDSSGFSYLLTLYRHVLRNCVFIYALDNKLRIPIGDDNALPEDYSEDTDADNGGVFGEDGRIDPTVDAALAIPTDLSVYMAKAQEYYNIVSEKNNVSWLDASYFKKTLKHQLKKDCETILKMIALCGKWEQRNDQKINELEAILRGTHSQYSEHGDDKVIVFTQYSDTARYVYNQLRKRGFHHVDIATGGSDNPTAIVEKFSPVSNDKELPLEEQTRILIATDVLSEGQNLQDAHVIINYDLPWAIIRLIQRAGRVDRIGQNSKDIYCYSFFPADGIEEIINLRGRLNDRINANADIVGSDEIFFEGNQQNLRDMFNERAGVLDDADDNDVDLASQAFQIWSAAIKRDKRLKEIIPSLQNMVYSTKAVYGPIKEGVITYARTANDFDVLTWLDHDGHLVTQSQQRILTALACEPGTEALPPLDDHHERVADAVAMVKEQAVTNVGGMLGNRFSTRYRIVQLLENYYQQGTNIFFSQERHDELKFAIDEIYNYPLQENAKFLLGRMLKNNARNADDDIVEYVLELRRNGQLCNIRDDDNPSREHKIICSMGLRKEDTL